MSVDDFVEYVRLMREAQDAYFRSGGDRAALNKAKHHERLVDEAVRKHKRRLDPVQGELFKKEA